MKKLFSLVLLLGIAIFFLAPAYSQDNAPVIKNNVPSVDLNSPGFITNSDNNRALVTVLPTNNSTSNNARAPQGSKLFNNCRYVITSTEMAASGFTGMVTSVGWRWNNPTGAGAPTSQGIATTGNLRVYMKDTAFSGPAALTGTYIDTMGVGYTKVIDATISIPSGTAEINIDVPVGGPGTGTYTYTPGMGVMIIYVYKTTTTLAALNTPTVSCTNVQNGTTIINGMCTYQSTTAPGAIGGLTAFRPETRFGNVAVDVYALSNIWGLGKVPTPWGCPDTICYRLQKFIVNPQPIVIRIRVININPFPGNTKFDSTFVLNVDHPNPFDTILAWQRPWNYQGWKHDSIIIEVQPKPGEDIVDNNRNDWRQEITCDAWNWARGSKNPDGGVGFTGGTGEFVACFRNNCPVPTPLWAVDLCFNAFTGGGNQRYRVIVLGDGGGAVPGPIIYRSQYHRSPPGSTGNPQRIQVALPNVMVPPNSRFYVGLEQDSLANLSVCYQSETPVKTGRFFYNADTNYVGAWVDFGPNNAPFRLDICPRTVSRVNITAYLEGFYNGTIMTADTARLQARQATSPYALVDVAINHLQPNGMGWFEFCRLECNIPYYFVVRHRNHIQTWTANPLVYDCELPYNFTDNITKAFGNNMVFVPGDGSGSSGAGGGYAFFTSDVNQDDVVDGFDCSAIDNDAANFATGYLDTDVNGDEIVDGFDLAYCDNNSANFVAASTP